MIDKKLIFITEHSDNKIIFHSLSQLQYKSICLDIILKQSLVGLDLNKLLKVLIYIVQLNCIQKINLYTNDRNIYKIKNNYKSDRFEIKPIIMLETIVDNKLIGLNDYTEIFVIDNNEYIKMYNPEIFSPILFI